MRVARTEGGGELAFLLRNTAALAAACCCADILLSSFADTAGGRAARIIWRPAFAASLTATTHLWSPHISIAAAAFFERVA